LVVEDEALAALDLEDFLDQRGARVIGPAASVSQALEAINGNQIDCALLDVKLGDETADAAAVALAQWAIPTVLVTGYGDGNLPQVSKRIPRLGYFDIGRTVDNRRGVERSCVIAAPVGLRLRGRYAEAEFGRDRTKQAVERVLDPSCSGGPQDPVAGGAPCSFR
jgi:CheY-like chemotaxis protein